MNILVTGCAGFIGFHLCNKLQTNKKIKLIGVDDLNSYYDVKLKRDRLKLLKINKNFSFIKVDISETTKLTKKIRSIKIDYIIHLAAQAGVRYSIKHPYEYVKSNLLGFYNILDIANKLKVKHFIFASTSSVYGDNNNFPLSEKLKTNQPLSFYAATKVCNESLAYSYSNIYKLPCTGLRFFTVYGPYGRPDMALFKFTSFILKRKKIINLNIYLKAILSKLTYRNNKPESWSIVTDQKPIVKPTLTKPASG